MKLSSRNIIKIRLYKKIQLRPHMKFLVAVAAKSKYKDIEKKNGNLLFCIY